MSKTITLRIYSFPLKLILFDEIVGKIEIEFFDSFSTASASVKSK